MRNSGIGSLYNAESPYRRGSLKFGDQTLDYETADYELWHNASEDLQYVHLKVAGLRKLAARYEESGIAPIHVEEMTFDEKERFWYGRSLIEHKEDLLYGKIIKVADALPNGQMQGMAINATNQEGYLMHSLLFLVAKGEDGLIRIVDFEEDLPKISNETGLIDINFSAREGECLVLPINVGNYKNYLDRSRMAQKDPHSCSVMAIDILKNCLVDQQFLQSVMSLQPNLYNRNSIDLPKIILGQGSEYIAQLSQDKKDKYVISDNDHEVNYKAFYKGHDYALKLNHEHLEHVREKSKELFQQISQRRRDFKATSVVQLDTNAQQTSFQK